MVPAHTAYLGLGANLGDPIQKLLDARRRITDFDGSQTVRCSKFYLSSPVGYAQQPDFVNCVLEVVTKTPVDDFFTLIRGAETDLGRVRDGHNQNAARLIDIDLLLFDDMQITSDDLIVPHPRMKQRLFVLQPLAELLADGSHSRLGRIQDLLAHGDFRGQALFPLSL